MLRRLRGRSENMVQIMGYCESPELVLVTKLVPNGSLHPLIYSKEEYQAGFISRIVQGTAQGLSCVHALGIIHLDIKPSNILLDQRMEAVISDFGVAAVANNSSSHAAGDRMMAREQAMGFTPAYGARPSSLTVPRS